MWDSFRIYLDLGFHHILDIHGYDHILFVTALCGIYALSDWRNVLILVTAFTVGHSLTLALSVFNILSIQSSLIELLIPVTILVTALTHLFQQQGKHPTSIVTYIYALFFGLIHGMGFSNYLKSLLGRESGTTIPLLAFNIGLEAGQIIVVLVVLLLSYIINNLFRIPRREWNLFLSSTIFGIALVMTFERIG